MSIAFEPWFNPRESTVILVGCGGTGSELAKILSRMVYHLRELGQPTPNRIVFVDPDIVEAKNIGRQGFVPADIGCYKAELLANRMNMALGLDIQFYCEAYNPGKHGNSAYSRQNLLLGAVDNHHARRQLAKTKSLWIDCGNGREHGQVIIGNTDSKQDIRQWGEKEVKSLPNAAMVFPELLKPEQTPAPTDMLSCAELLLRGEQHLLVNQQMAIVAASYVYKLFTRQPITSHMTYVDIESLAMRSVPITPELLEQYGHELER